MSQKFTDKPRIRVCVENGQMRGILLVRRWGYGNLALCHGVNISVVFVLMFSKAYSPPTLCWEMVVPATLAILLRPISC